MALILDVGNYLNTVLLVYIHSKNIYKIRLGLIFNKLKAHSVKRSDLIKKFKLGQIKVNNNETDFFQLCSRSTRKGIF
jgi:hypothetical protein